ncbi:hypothetical protein JCM16303_003548 [Sporobolomyces ruberrimus]
MSHNPSPSLFDSPFTSPAAERPSSRLPSHPHRDSLQLDEILSSLSVPPASDPAPGTGPASLSLQFFGPSSQPIDLSAFNRIQFDSNSFDDYRTPQLGQEEHYEANTPSYCGSWTSDFSSSASPTRYSNPTPPRYHLHESPSFEHLYQEAANKTRQLSLEQNTEMPPFDSTAFDEPSVDQAHHGGSEDLEASMNDGKDRDMTLMMPRTDGAQVPGGIATNGSAGTGGAAQRPFAYTRSSSGFNSFLNYANSPTTERGRPATPAYSATRSTVYDPISDSTATSGAPAVSVGSFSPPVATSTSSANGTPALSKLQIPTGPSVSLTGPTPETAKPRPKGRGTLELERVLGLWAAKTPTSTFPSLPPLSSIGPPSPTTSDQPLFTQSIVSSEPESFVPGHSTTSSNSTSAAQAGTSSATTSYSSSNPSFPDFSSSRDRSSGDSLAPPNFPPRRRRSKSDTDVMRADSLGFPHSNLPVGPYVDPPPIVTDRPTFNSTIAPPTPVDGPGNFTQQFAMNPNETWRSPLLPSSYTTNPVSALDLNNPNQRELASRNRSPHFYRHHGAAGGPGYHEAALLDIPADGGRSRRSRSQGAGHRSSRSDDFSHLLPSMQQSISQPILTTTSNGLLAPPTQSQAPSPVPSGPSPVPSQAGSPYLQEQALPQPPSAPSPFASQHGSPYPTQGSPYSQPQQHQAFTSPAPPSQDQPSQPFPPPPQDQGYLANQAALLASAALIAFNPSDPAYAAAAAAGYLPPAYPQYPAPYNLPFGSPYGPPPGLPALPSHHQPQHQQLPYPPRRPSSVHSAHAARATLGASRDPSPGGPAPLQRSQHPSYVYHSPLNQLPSPPPTATTAAEGNGQTGATRSSTRGKRRSVVKHEVEDDGDEDASMRLENNDVEGEDEQDEEDVEGEEDENGSRSSPGTGNGVKGKGKKSSTTRASRSKRQASEEGFTERSKTTQATIDAAKRRRNANAVAKFVCELCGETFTRRYNLRGHQRAHMGEKPYKCSYDGCDKAFARAHDCKRHELLHLGVRKYHCSPCKRDFVRLDALHRHHRSEVGQACVKQLEAEGYVFDEKGAAVTL